FCLSVCNQIKTGVHAILGPSNGLLSCHINSICDALDIPHIEIRADAEHTAREFSINLHPFQDIINDAFLDIIHYLNWTKVAILHENQHGLVQLRRLMQTSLEVHVRYVNPLTYVQYLNEMKEMEMHNLILDTKTDNVHIILKTILKLQMNEYKYHYFITSFDIEKFDLEDFKYNFANITSFCLVDVNDVGVKKTLKELEIYKNLQKPNNEDLQFFRKLHTVETIPALIYDSVHIFVIGLQSLQQSHFLRVANVSCESPQTWKGGLSLINYINSVEWKGLTGPIRFKEGRRTQFKLDLVKLKQHSIVKIGEWSPHMRLNITEPSLFFDTGSMNVTLVVITILEKPYVMMRYGKNYTGNNRFYGFCVDVLRLVARDVGFDYILDLVPDRKYGAKDPLTGQWNGMVEQLMKYKADLAVGSMTITYARESVIDFTKPFMNLGISILFKVPSTPSTKLFSFMNPLAFDVWLYVLAAYFCVSITIHAMAKISAIERSNFNRSSKYFVKYLDKFTLRNSFWFAVGTLMQQSSNLKPRAISVRIVSAVWWFFSLIIIASYTANLAAFLTVERMTTPIENAEDLSSQTEISYGTLESGSTMTFFRDSLIETYRKMWRNMENIKKHSTFTSTYEEGIKRVKESNYAFLMESTMLDYVVQRDCNLTQIGGLLDTKGIAHKYILDEMKRKATLVTLLAKASYTLLQNLYWPSGVEDARTTFGYGIATPKGSPWRDKISLAILELQEKGDIQMLYDKWWKSVGETCFPRSNTKQSKANALGFDNIGKLNKQVKMKYRQAESMFPEPDIPGICTTGETLSCGDITEEELKNSAASGIPNEAVKNRTSIQAKKKDDWANQEILELFACHLQRLILPHNKKNAFADVLEDMVEAFLLRSFLVSCLPSLWPYLSSGSIIQTENDNSKF
uniref:Uncharacterized protein n=1 Tax=Glossina morsitans morsitans TaxID=37546 RepID=A0A1B0FM60_GLOMM